MSDRPKAGELLLEVRVEEIPARMLPGAIQELGTRLFEELMARSVPPSEIESGFTPRRLWLVFKGLPSKEDDRSVVEIGPPAAAAFDAQGRPTAAALGFAKKFGVEVSALGRRDFAGEKSSTVKGERVVLERVVAGRSVRELLVELIPSLLRGLSWAKTMKWGNGIGPWVRPLHGIVALLDGEVLPFELFEVASGRTTRGHPTLSPEPFEVTGVADWRTQLAARGIVPTAEARLVALRDGMLRRAEAAGGRLVDDPELLGKLAAICEIPGVMEGALAPGLLELPREVLATSLRDHQSALTVERADGSGDLLPLFLTVMDRADDPAGRVRAGNEWVVAARLADARFFWQKDRKTPLKERVAALEGLAFHPRLGSYAQKRHRLERVCTYLADDCFNLKEGERKALVVAASLSKCDLLTDMVREFTSLQGAIGGIYAREEGQPSAIWTAIYDQYYPAGTDDPLPRELSGRILALADRIDTLVGFFGLGLTPTGSKDPFGLRRAAQGVVRLMLEHGGQVALQALVTRSHALFTAALPNNADKTWALLRPFFEDRLRYLFELEGFAYDEIEAALKREGETLSYLQPLRARVAALHEARRSADFLAVVFAAKRIANITKDQAETKLHESGLELEAERTLLAAATSCASGIERSLAGMDFASGFAAVAQLAPSLEAFFKEVMVMDPDEKKRANRVALLRGIGRSIQRLADLSQLVVDKSDYR